MNNVVRAIIYMYNVSLIGPTSYEKASIDLIFSFLPILLNFIARIFLIGNKRPTFILEHSYQVT